MKIAIEYISANDVFDDDNQGYIYGIDYIDLTDDEIIEEEWFKTEEERDRVANASGYPFVDDINVISY